jgi:predicted Zn-dependent peptidase
MKGIISDIAELGVSAEELELARNYMIGMHRFDSESVSYQASALANLSALGYPISHFLQRSQRISAIDMQTINEVASCWLKTSDLYIHILQ